MGKIIFSVSLDKELFQVLESQRGLVTRSAYVEFLLNKLLKEKSEVVNTQKNNSGELLFN